MNEYKEEWYTFLKRCEDRIDYRDFIYDLRYLQENNPFARSELIKIAAEIEHEEIISEAQEIPSRAELGTAKQLFHAAKSEGYLLTAELQEIQDEYLRNKAE